MENFLNNISGSLFQEALTSDVSLKTILLTLIVSLVLGLATSWVYKKTFRGVSYTSSFVSSLVLLPLISSLVLLTIGSNIARAFGLIGTLAIIRFRTPVKDPKDLIYIFLSLAVGIISGTQNYHIALVGVPLVLLIMYVLEKFNYGSFSNTQYFFTFKIKKDNFRQEDIEALLNTNCKTHSLNSINSVYDEKETLRIVYKIVLLNKGSEKNILKELSSLSNIENISLVSSENYVEY
jgi:uncharacterized membrane protein YhiD involved in acid resistance